MPLYDFTKTQAMAGVGGFVRHPRRRGWGGGTIAPPPPIAELPFLTVADPTIYNLTVTRQGAEWRSATNATRVGNPATGIVVNKPAGVADGDVLYAFICKTELVGAAAFTCSGWTSIFGNPFSSGGNPSHFNILRKVITTASGEPSTYTFVTSTTNVAATAAIIVCVSGANTTTPEDVTFTTAQRFFGQNAATPPSLALTTVTNNALVLQYNILALGAVTPKTWGPPSGYTQDANATATETGTTSNDLQCGVAYKTQSVAGAVGTNAWTHSPSDATTEYTTAVLAVRPA